MPLNGAVVRGFNFYIMLGSLFSIIEVCFPAVHTRLVIEHDKKPPFGGVTKEDGWGDWMIHPPPDAGVLESQSNK